jgi:hypothetical protein
VLAIAGALACGSFGAAPADGGTTAADEGGAGSDGGGSEPDALVTPDAPPPALERKCAVGSPFAAPAPVPTGAPLGMESFRFDPVQKVAYVSLCPAAGPKSECELYTATLPVGSGAMKIAASAAAKYDSYPNPSPDGAYMIFASDRNGAPKMFKAAASANGGFVTPVPFALTTTPTATENANEPYLLRNGKVLYFSGAPTGSSDYDMFRSEGGPAFGQGRLLTNVTGKIDVAPVVAEDELEMFFASDRGGSIGGLDLWTATRTAANATYEFNGETVLPLLSHAGVDYPTWLSPDACDLYIIRKPNVSTPGTLYVAHRQ